MLERTLLKMARCLAGTISKPASVMRLESGSLRADNAAPTISGTTTFDDADGEMAFMVQAGAYMYIGVSSSPAQIKMLASLETQVLQDSSIVSNLRASTRLLHMLAET